MVWRNSLKERSSTWRNQLSAQTICSRGESKLEKKEAIEMREEFEVELKEYQHEYLTKMVENFDLPDLGKAVRCLIDYAIDEAELELSLIHI